MNDSFGRRQFQLRIFLSYRRDDHGASACVVRIYEKLSEEFEGRIFMDVENIIAGENFREVIDFEIYNSNVLLVLIGPQWLEIINERRDLNEDFVRLEIESALKHKLTIIPVVQSGATMPQPESLPESIRAMADSQAFLLDTGVNFKGDMLRFTKHLKKIEEKYTLSISENPHTKAQLSEDVEILNLKGTILRYLRFAPETSTLNDWATAVCLAIQDRILENARETWRIHRLRNVKRVYYFSLEFFTGRLLESNLINLGKLNLTRQALRELGQDLNSLFERFPDPGLGSSGLGRLASCFMDSLSSLDFPAIGYGIFYEFGLFRQAFVDGMQVELSDKWRRFGNPDWICRTEYAVEVPVYGYVENQFDELGQGKPVWIGTHYILGVPWDALVTGYDSKTVNFLRLWESRASRDFDLDIFNRGGYVEAVREKAQSESISKVLYPNDSTELGKELRLVQQYFFVTCSLHDIVRRHCESNDTWDSLPDKAAIHLNDSSPAIAIVELMRILIDEKLFDWNRAWAICEKTFSYTNNTLLQDGLEKWSIPLFEKVLPRHLHIIFEINKHFLENDVEKKWPGDDAKKSELSLIEEIIPKQIRMAHLAVVCCHTTNGVSAFHTELSKNVLFKSFNELYPGRIQNKTNGISPRRWLKTCNPDLSEFIDRSIGSDWPKDLERLKELENFVDDSEWCEEFMAIKRRNKERLGRMISEHCGITVDPSALFDVQIKRLHEVNRHHLNLLHIVTLYRRLLDNRDMDIVPRVFVFGAKSAPDYAFGKEIIHAINSVGGRINNDQRIKDKLKVALIPNYGISVAETIVPACDLSEQICVAGGEASGTSNMKLALNGALTIGTLGGSNIELLEEVSNENIFIFGLTVEGVKEVNETGFYRSRHSHDNQEIQNSLEWLTSDYFAPHGSFDQIRHSLLEGGDPFMVISDFKDYVKTQEKVDEKYRDRRAWAKSAILNTARSSKFSSDRTIREYAGNIWKLRQEI